MCPTGVDLPDDVDPADQLELTAVAVSALPGTAALVTLLDVWPSVLEGAAGL